MEDVAARAEVAVRLALREVLERPHPEEGLAVRAEVRGVVVNESRQLFHR
jgi:hypothetical protein